jgi:hypothetical protein
LSNPVLGISVRQIQLRDHQISPHRMLLNRFMYPHHRNQLCQYRKLPIGFSFTIL